MGDAREADRTNRLYWLLLLPAAILVGALYVLPIARVLLLSVTVPEPGLQNYALLFTSGTIATVVKTTIRVCLVCTLLTVAAGYVMAYALIHVRGWHRQALLFCVLLPFWLSVLVRSFAWVMLLSRNGVVNQTLLGIGLVSEPLALVRNEFGVVVGMVHYMLPYAVLVLFASMQGIDQDLVAASRGLGARPFQAFVRVFLPLSKPGIVAATVLVFVLSLGFYVTPAVLGGGKTVMIAEYIGFNILQNVRWGLAAMLATVLLAAVFLILGIMSRAIDLRRLYGAA